MPTNPCPNPGGYQSVWDATRGCCVNTEPPDASGCPGNGTTGGNFLSWDSVLGMCTNLRAWQAGGAGGLSGSFPFYAMAACYSGTPNHLGSLWSAICQTYAGHPGDSFYSFDGCQCIRDPFGTPVRIGCPALTELGDPAPYYSFGIRPDTGCCGEEMVFGCPDGWEESPTTPPTTVTDAAHGHCVAGTPVGYNDDCVGDCLTGPANPSCPSGYTFDTVTGMCIEATDAVSFVRSQADRKLYITYRDGSGHILIDRFLPADDSLEATVTVDSNTDCFRPEIAEFGSELKVAYSRSNGHGYVANSKDRGRTWTMITLPYSGDLFEYQWSLNSPVKYLVAMIYTQSDKKWRVSTYRDPGTGILGWSAQVDIGVTAKMTTGRLRQKGTMRWEFLFQDDATGNRRVVHCDNLSIQTAAGTWS